jgi:hypothetical protein
MARGRTLSPSLRLAKSLDAVPLESVGAQTALLSP